MNTILHTWLKGLAATIESLTGVKPVIRPASETTARAFPEGLVWWEAALDKGLSPLWIGAEKPVRQKLGNHARGAAGEGSAEEAYVELLRRSCEGRLVETPPQGAETFDVPVELPGTGVLHLAVALHSSWRGQQPGIPERDAPGIAGIDALFDLELPLTVRLGRTRMDLREIVRLNTGSVVEFSRRPDEPVDILVNDHVVARGDVVVVQGNYAVRVTEITGRREPMHRTAAIGSAQLAAGAGVQPCDSTGS